MIIEKSYMSAFLDSTNTRTTKFGLGSQSEYTQEANKAVEAICNSFEQPDRSLRTAIQLGCKLRQQIAQQFHTPDTESFGLLRKENPTHLLNLTMLSESYSPYALLFYKNVASLIESVKKTQKSVIRTTQFKGVPSTISCSLISAEKIVQLFSLPSLFDENRSYKNKENLCFFELVKKEKPELYQSTVLAIALDHLFRNTNFPNQNFTIFHIVQRLAMEGLDGVKKSYALSQHLLLEHMLPDGNPRISCLVIHQNTFLIDHTIHDAESAFRQAMEWSSSTQSTTALTEYVGRIRYNLAHAMVAHRGSAAIAEWIEAAIYRHLGKRPENAGSGLENAAMSPKTMLDLDALINTLDQFMSIYQNGIILT